MEMKKISAGKLRSIGYDKVSRILLVQLDDCSLLQYSAVSEDLWRRFSSSGSAWSFYRDNIQEEFAVKRVAANAADTDSPPAGRNPLDDLFKSD